MERTRLLAVRVLGVRDGDNLESCGVHGGWSYWRSHETGERCRIDTQDNVEVLCRVCGRPAQPVGV